MKVRSRKKDKRSKGTGEGVSKGRDMLRMGSTHGRGLGMGERIYGSEKETKEAWVRLRPIESCRL